MPILSAIAPTSMPSQPTSRTRATATSATSGHGTVTPKTSARGSVAAEYLAASSRDPYWRPMLSVSRRRRRSSPP